MKINFEFKDLAGATIIFLMGLIYAAASILDPASFSYSDITVATLWVIASSGYLIYTWRKYKKSR